MEKKSKKNGSKVTVALFLRAAACEKVGPGVVRVDLQAEEATAEDRAAIERMFPRLGDEAYRLLNQELLLDSIATPSQVEAADAAGQAYMGKPDYVPAPEGWKSE